MRNIQILIVIFAIFILSVFAGKVVTTQSPITSFTIMLAAIAAIVTFLKPEAGLVGLLVAMLFSPDFMVGKAAITERAVTFRASDMLIIAIGFGWMAKLAIKKEIGMVVRTPITRAIIIFSVIIILATLQGILMGTVIPYRGFLFLLKRLQYFLIFFMVINNVRTEKGVKLSTILFVIAGVIVAVIGMVQQGLYKGTEVTAGGITSMFGVGQANTLGGFLVLELLLIICLFRIYKTQKVRLLLCAAFLIVLYSLLLTYSRGSYVSFAVAIAAVSFLTKKARLAVTISAVIVIAVIMSPKEISEEISSIRGVIPGLGVSPPSWEARVEAARASIPRIMRYPLLGTGVSSIRLDAIDIQYFHEARETGLVGLGTFLFLLISIFRMGLTLLKHSEDPFIEMFGLAFLGGLIGFLVHSLASATFYTIRTMEPFWFLAGLAAVLCIKIEEGQKEK